MRSDNPVGPGVGDLGTSSDGGVPGDLGKHGSGDQDDRILDLDRVRQATESSELLKTYGGGLFAPLLKRDFLQLKRQFEQIIPPNELGDVSVWARARHSVHTRDDIQREKRLDH